MALLACSWGDGAYDSAYLYAAVEERHPDALVIVPPRAGAVASSQTSPTQRDGHIRNIAARGRRGWPAASGYNRRALVEAQIGRYKRVIGNTLRSHTEEARRAEVAIADHVLNRMNDRSGCRPEPRAQTPILLSFACPIFTRSAS
jgi:hypothetical protein